MEIDVMGWIRNHVKPQLVSEDQALPGRDTPVLFPMPAHELFGLRLDEVPPGCEVTYFALGCYWGAEKVFWNTDGVVNTAVGFMGGYTPNPTYRETCTGSTGHAETVRVVFDPNHISFDQLVKVFWNTDGVVNTAVGFMGGYTPNPTYKETCTGSTGHAETVRVVFDPNRVSFEQLVKVFFEHHDPTTANRQGNDVGTQYRSAIFPTNDAQVAAAQRIRDAFQGSLHAAGLGEITTEITPGKLFFYAEREHQQYLHKNPDGYDCHFRTGIACPIP